MIFSKIHIYADGNNFVPKIAPVVKEIRDYFSSAAVFAGELIPFTNQSNTPEVEIASSILPTRITDTKVPLESQPVRSTSQLQSDLHLELNRLRGIAYSPNENLYDGFAIQDLYANYLPQETTYSKDVNVVITDRLLCTFDENSWRYHARTVVCGTPALVSTSGIVEGPARPREFYFLRQNEGADIGKNIPAETEYLTYGDIRIVLAVTGCVLQALFFFLTDGEPFCGSETCRLYNSHWQREIIKSQVKDPKLCEKHHNLLTEFNTRIKSARFGSAGNTV